MTSTAKQAMLAQMKVELILLLTMPAGAAALAAAQQSASCAMAAYNRLRLSACEKLTGGAARVVPQCQENS